MTRGGAENSGVHAEDECFRARRVSDPQTSPVTGDGGCRHPTPSGRFRAAPGAIAHGSSRCDGIGQRRLPRPPGDPRGHFACSDRRRKHADRFGGTRDSTGACDMNTAAVATPRAGHDPDQFRVPRSGITSRRESATICHFLAVVRSRETAQKVATLFPKRPAKNTFLDGSLWGLHNLMIATSRMIVVKLRGLRDHSTRRLLESPTSRMPAGRGSAYDWPGEHRCLHVSGVKRATTLNHVTQPKTKSAGRAP
jgi:hypothetical protein